MYFFCVFIILFILNDKITATEINNNGSEVQRSDSKQNNTIEDPVVLLISFDGFRNEYLLRNATPYINQLRAENSYSEYMRNVFPTKTFTNHHSISTGMYPGQHGVLNNEVYDMKLKRLLHYEYDMFHYNKAIEPIYVSQFVIILIWILFIKISQVRNNKIAFCYICSQIWSHKCFKGCLYFACLFDIHSYTEIISLMELL